MSDVATKDYVDKLVEAQEVTLQALTSAPITIGEDDPCDGSDESPQSLMHLTVLRLDQAHKAALREVDEYRTAIMHLEDRIQQLEDCAETAWGIIANVSGGNWAEQRADWREAAIRWRDEHFYPELSERKAREVKP